MSFGKRITDLVKLLLKLSVMVDLQYHMPVEKSIKYTSLKKPRRTENNATLKSNNA